MLAVDDVYTLVVKSRKIRWSDRLVAKHFPGSSSSVIASGSTTFVRFTTKEARDRALACDGVNVLNERISVTVPVSQLRPQAKPKASQPKAVRLVREAGWTPPRPEKRRQEQHDGGNEDDDEDWTDDGEDFLVKRARDELARVRRQQRERRERQEHHERRDHEHHGSDRDRHGHQVDADQRIRELEVENAGLRERLAAIGRMLER